MSVKREGPEPRRPAKPPRVPTTAKLGKRGQFVIPAGMRKSLGLGDGSVVIVEQRDREIVVRPATVLPEVEIYTPERKAEFLLNNALDQEDYAWALREARNLGVDPMTIPHFAPTGKRVGPRIP